MYILSLFFSLWFLFVQKKKRRGLHVFSSFPLLGLSVLFLFYTGGLSGEGDKTGVLSFITCQLSFFFLFNNHGSGLEISPTSREEGGGGGAGSFRCILSL